MLGISCNCQRKRIRKRFCNGVLKTLLQKQVIINILEVELILVIVMHQLGGRLMVLFLTSEL